jgi:hypothetical protein
MKTCRIFFRSGFSRFNGCRGKRALVKITGSKPGRRRTENQRPLNRSLRFWFVCVGAAGEISSSDGASSRKSRICVVTIAWRIHEFIARGTNTLRGHEEEN